MVLCLPPHTQDPPQDPPTSKILINIALRRRAQGPPARKGRGGVAL